MYRGTKTVSEGFTLAEVLITLGIIGIVAAMTLPTIVQKYRNQVVETRLEKFYSAINQAIRRAEVDYGDKSYWFENQSKLERHQWMKKYLLPYMKITKYKQVTGGTSGIMVYYLPDGSAFSSINGGEVNRDWLFWPGNPDKCPNKDSSTGVCRFWFFYSPTSDGFYKNKGLEPWRNGDTVEEFYDNCQNSKYRYNCAALIQANGWKIPKNYPYKVRF